MPAVSALLLHDDRGVALKNVQCKVRNTITLQLELRYHNVQRLCTEVNLSAFVYRLIS